VLRGGRGFRRCQDIGSGRRRFRGLHGQAKQQAGACQ